MMRTRHRWKLFWRLGLLLTGVVLLACRNCLSARGEERPAQPVRFMAYHSYLRDLSTISEFGGLGINVVTCFPANTLSSVGVPYSPYPPIWIGPGMYDFACLDRQMEDVVKANPRARIVLEIDLNTPVWWPRWLGAAADRDDSFTKLGKVAGHPGWRKETKDYLQTVLKHLEANHAQRVIAYVLTAGMTLEWQDMARGEESTSRRRAWRDWAIAQGLDDPVDIPPASIREHVSHGVFRDPLEDSLALAYWRFNADLIAETILFYASAAQEIIRHRVPLGVYYGYWLEHGQGRLLYEGHLGFEKVLAARDIDFFLAPGSYFDRQLGGGSGFMMCVSSVRHHGKGLVHEVDHRTHSARSVTLLGRPVPGHESGFPDERSTIAGLRREFALALIQGTAIWWFDMFGHWYDGRNVREALAQMAQLWDQYAEKPARSVAEVAVFVDCESFLYLDGQAAIYNDLVSRQRFGLARLGAPYDIYVFSDLATVDLSRYKMVIFPNLFCVNEAKRGLLLNRVCQNGRTVVWVYAPGIITDGRYDPAHVEQLTGIPFGIPTLEERQFPTWRSVLAPQPNLSAQTLRDLAARAGVHLYCPDEQVCYVNDCFFALHTASPGRWKIRLPARVGQIREIFSRRLLAENSDAFVLEADGPETFLCELQQSDRP